MNILTKNWVCLYMYIFVCLCMYVYMNIYKPPGLTLALQIDRKINSIMTIIRYRLCVNEFMYISIYIYIHMSLRNLYI
jgi:hypothetical protein